jgi:hypothetical protein
MRIYKDAIRYEEKTGKPYTRRVVDCIRCDYTGKVLGKYTDEGAYCNFDVGYSDTDPCFGSDGYEYDFSELGVDVYSFLNERYVYYEDWDDYSDLAEEEMLKEIVKIINSGEVPFFGYPTAMIRDYMRAFKIRAAWDLINSGEIKVEDLNP